jgi:hypothetical protein
VSSEFNTLRMTKERQMTRTKAGRDVINERLRWVRLVMGSAEKGRGVLMGNRIAGKGRKFILAITSWLNCHTLGAFAAAEGIPPKRI